MHGYVSMESRKFMVEMDFVVVSWTGRRILVADWRYG